ncbi:porin family protein [Xanthovirga aplysinae]|uniref:porin family protein n=1 Tax=Xanthovirga aplysinae TaxID=2529853 RepID=UPI0012BC7EE8|nr:porin family protein [Xanthovirga aplysinae]MTI31600.1 PorT family protein [Xanthovirga aplysinae]
MKKSIGLLALICLLSTWSAKAQEVELGLKGGLNFSTLGENSDNDPLKLGFHAGGYLSVPVSPNFSIQPELLYSQQGEISDWENATYRYDYINVPVMGKIYLTDGLNVQIGPQLGFLTAAKYKTGRNTKDITDEINPLDLSLGFGVGYEGRSGANFTLRYNAGLYDTEKYPKTDYNYYNQVIQISLGHSI